MPLTVAEADFSDPQLRALLVAHLAGMHANSPPDAVHALDLTGLQRPDVSLYVLRDGADLVAMGALKALPPDGGEIKSMRTDARFLRRGAAAHMLEHLIAEARARGCRRLSLETGRGEAFEPALALYRKYGFRDGDAFGDYKAGSFSQFLHLSLD